MGADTSYLKPGEAEIPLENHSSRLAPPQVCHGWPGIVGCISFEGRCSERDSDWTGKHQCLWDWGVSAQWQSPCEGDRLEKPPVLGLMVSFVNLTQPGRVSLWVDPWPCLWYINN